MEKKGVLIPMVLAMLAAVFYLMVLTSKERALNSDYEKAKVEDRDRWLAAMRRLRARIAG